MNLELNENPDKICVNLYSKNVLCVIYNYWNTPTCKLYLFEYVKLRFSILQWYMITRESNTCTLLAFLTYSFACNAKLSLIRFIFAYVHITVALRGKGYLEIKIKNRIEYILQTLIA